MADVYCCSMPCAQLGGRFEIYEGENRGGRLIVKLQSTGYISQTTTSLLEAGLEKVLQ